MRRLAHYLLISLMLAGCQNAALHQLDYDTRQDFSLWKTWQWAEPAVEFYSREQHSDLDTERVRKVVGEQLLQWGFLTTETQPDFLVQAWLGQQERIERFHVSRGGYWGDPWGRYWGGPGWLEVQDISYRVFTLQIDILDAQTGQLAWRASEQWPATSSNTRPRQREAEIRKAARRILQSFPPAPR